MSGNSRSLRPRDDSRAFTLIELLIITLVIAIIAALVLAAVQAARAAALNTKCASNMRQLGIALSSYATAVGSLPHTNNAKRGFSVHTMVLPYIDQKAVYNAFNFSLRPTDGCNATAARTAVSVFLCPTDTGPVRPSVTNYPCNVGYGFQITRGFNGMFVSAPSAPTSLAAIPDGASSTVLMAEWVRGPGTRTRIDLLGTV